MSFYDHIIPSLQGWQSQLARVEPYLRKRNAGPWRDPLVVWCQALSAPVMLAMAIWYRHEPLVALYFASVGLLQVSTAWYHYHKPSWAMFFIDQIAIMMVTLAIGVAFTHHWWVWFGSAVLLGIALPIKFIEAQAIDKHVVRRCTNPLLTKIGLATHFVIGGWSTILILCWGMPAREIDHASQTAMMLYAAILGFVLSGVVYGKQWQWQPLATWVGYTEWKHSMANTAMYLIGYVLVIT